MTYHIEEQALQVHQLSVEGIVLPGRDLNSILGLAAEVLLDVINDEGLRQVTASASQILDVVSGGS